MQNPATAETVLLSILIVADGTETSLDIERRGRQIRRRYADNGPGFPSAIIDGDHQAVGTGFDLIKGILVHSLKGAYLLSNRSGAEFTFSFDHHL